MSLRRAVAVFGLGMLMSAPSIFAEDCRFKVSGEGNLKAALGDFHDVMSELIHGPVEKGDYGPVREKAPEMARLKDSVMAATLPKSLESRCGEISEKASGFGTAVDELLAASRTGSDEAKLKPALDRVHRGYQELNGSLVTLEGLLDDYHTLIRPLWHEAYPRKDVAAIKDSAPKLRIRARLILATAEKLDPSKVEKAKKLQNATILLDDAIAAEDDPSVLEALRVVHDTYEDLAAGSYSEGS